MAKLRKVSGQQALKILCNRFGFSMSGRTGSHIRLSKMTNEGKVGTVVPMHKEIKIGTLNNVLKLEKIDKEEFAKHL